MPEIDEERFSRQLALFGAEGQRKIQETRAVIVGLGGLGSHMAQELSFLGVRDHVLVDDDIITASSRNRVIGARPSDVIDQTLKIAVAERLILEIDPDARVAAHLVKVADAPDAFIGRTVIVGCVDDDLARLQLAELAARHALRYFDLASDTGIDEDGVPAYGGRIVFSDGTRCLHCLDLLDQEEIRRSNLPEEARKAHDEIYGI